MEKDISVKTVQYIDHNLIMNFFDKLNHLNCEYVLIKNIGNELPYKLPDKKDIDLLVREVDKDVFWEFMNEYTFHGYKFKEVEVPSPTVWQYMYGLPEPAGWELESEGKILKIDVSFKLSCACLIPCASIPLDRSIQERIWNYKVWDDRNKWWIMDKNTRFAYYYVRSIFDKQFFSPQYINEIKLAWREIDLDIVKKILSKVFYNFTDILIEKAQKNEFETIVRDYYSFAEY